MVTDFSRQSAKIGIPHLHSVRVGWHSTRMGRLQRHWMLTLTAAAVDDMQPYDVCYQ